MEDTVRFHPLEYRRKMAEDNRVVSISEDGVDFLTMYFSITDDYLPYAKKETFEYMPHNPQGKYCFVEKMVALKWNKEIRKQVDCFITENYPSVQYGVWFRTKLKNGKYVNNEVKVRRLCITSNF